MTERLYHQDAYIKRFTATVRACEMEGEGRYRVRLDRTAFYATSGGQPHDTGTLGRARVLDVIPEGEDEIIHVVDAPLAVGGTVEGEIDWARRFDHMQQHAGDHMMAGVIHEMLGGYTIGLHIGADFSTIDVVLPDGRMRLDDEELWRIEARVNAQIQQDLPIRCWFPSAQEMEALPLRKDPSVADHIRVVMVGDVECVACGGTHPSTSGQIGLIKILDARPSRGKMRVSFVCGMRAIADYRAVHRSAHAAAALLSTQVEALPDAVERLLSRVRAAEHELGQVRLDAALSLVPALLDAAEPVGDGWRAVCTIAEGLSIDAMREVAGALVSEARVYALLADQQGDGAHLVFARSPGDGRDMGELLRAAVKPLGGKGGGRGEMAQGSANGMAALESARQMLLQKGDNAS